jgi:plasmid stabilization system protein ParE
MKIEISAGAEADITDGYWFYERQSIGLGDYFRSCIFVDIESLRYFAGIHDNEYGLHRSLSKRFPFSIYYTVVDRCVTVVAVLDLRREPLWIRESLDNRG